MTRKKITDGMILEFIEKYGFITIKQASKIFYKSNSRAYECARLKLKKVLEHGYIKVSDYKLTKENVYQLKGDPKNVGESRMVALNLYAEIYSLADSIEYFKLEEEWDTGATKRRSDAHIIFTMNKGESNEYMKAYCIEVENYYKLGTDKYDELFESRVIHEWYKQKYGAEWFPDVLVVSNGLRTIKPHKYEDYKIINLDYSMEGIVQKVIL